MTRSTSSTAPNNRGTEGQSDSREGLGRAFGLLGGFVAGSTVLGLLAAGIFMPVVGAAGLSVKSVVESFDAMPAEFTASPMSQQTRILAADGSTIATLAEINRQVVPLSEVAPIMIEAQIAVEDDRFYEHGGIDPRGIARALVATLRGDVQGASTITQQYVRQTLVTTALKDENKEGAEAAMERGGVAGIIRKLQEMKYAVALEENLTKEQVLEGYLNLVYYGAGSYGVEAASQRYFGKRASKLTLTEAAMIAGMVQRPSYTDPFVRPEATLARRNDVLERMYATGVITKAEHDKAVEAPLGLNPTTPSVSCPASVNPYFCDYVSNWLLDQPALGETREDRKRTLLRDGLKIETPFQPKLAEFARKEIAKRAPIGGSKSRGGAIAVVEPGTGKVLAIAQNTNYGQGSGEAGVETTVNWAVDGKYGASGGFQIGSTVKTFNLVAAMEKGMTPNTRIYVPPNNTPFTIKQLGGDKCGFTGQTYRPRNNEGKGYGNMTLKAATEKSVNTAFVQLAAEVGVCSLPEVMARMGLHTGWGEPYGTEFVPNAILGAGNASPVTLASAYATLASGGKRCDAIPVTRVTNFEGKELPVAGANCEQVLDPKVAYDVTTMLEGVMINGTGKRLQLAGGRESAGKTGTADASVHTWFAGYTPQLSAAAWVGRPNKQSPMPGVYGGTIAGPIWQAVMNEASKDMPQEKFEVKKITRKDENGSGDGDNGDAAVVDGENVSVPDVLGRSQNSAITRLEDDGFVVEVADEKVASDDVDFGRVAETTPRAGTEAPHGSTVTITLSDGPTGN